MPRAQIKVYENICDDGRAFIVRFNRRGVKVNRSFAYDPKVKAKKVKDQITGEVRTVPSNRELAFNLAKAYREAEWHQITNQGASVMTTTQLTLKPLIERYLAEETPTKKGFEEETYRIKQILRGIDKKKTLINTPIQKLGRDEFAALAQFLKDQGLSASSINRMIGIFAAVFDWAMDQDDYKWMKEAGNLATGHSFKIVHNRKRVPTADEIDLILAQTQSENLKLAILLGLETGARRGELVKARWEDILLDMTDDDMPSITFRDLKNGDLTKIVPLSKTAVKLLKAIDEEKKQGYLFASETNPEKTITPRSITVAFVRAKGRAMKENPKLADLRFHGIRGRFITDKAKLFKNHLALIALSGHKDLSVVKKHYYQPTAKELSEELGWTK
jgi:integrase